VAVARHGWDASDGQSNEGEDAGELHFERLFEVLESGWFCLIVLLVAVLDACWWWSKQGKLPFYRQNS
jgi:hypothetical protein